MSDEMLRIALEAVKAERDDLVRGIDLAQQTAVKWAVAFGGNTPLALIARQLRELIGDRATPPSSESALGGGAGQGPESPSAPQSVPGRLEQAEAPGRLRDDQAMRDILLNAPLHFDGDVSDDIDGILDAIEARLASAAPVQPEGDAELMRDILQRIAHDPGTAKDCQGCRTAISLALEGLGFLARASRTTTKAGER